jgi:hypothetical protein
MQLFWLVACVSGLKASKRFDRVLRGILKIYRKAISMILPLSSIIMFRIEWYERTEP